MSLALFSKDPAGLLRAFKKAIDEGHVATWKYDSDGDFTHNTEQWRNEAWLRPKVQSDRLALTILKPKNKNITREVYAIYHGRFIESMLAHCDSLFDNANATAMATVGDIVSA